MPLDTSSQKKETRTTSCTTLNIFFFILIAPIFLSVLIYQLDSFDPAPIPLPESTHPPTRAPKKNSHMLKGAEFIGVGELLGPEDIVYESESGLIYTGCDDGWVKRVKVNNSEVEDWVNTGGRPLGLAIDRKREVVIVADAYKGLLSVGKDGEVKLLTDEAEGFKFKLTDGVDVTEDGKIYFTDASSKYPLTQSILDILEGKPHGRLMSYDPTTKETKVLVKDLYFSNGVVVSPDQQSLVYCETPLRRCSRYYLQGKKAGQVEIFLGNLPGMPDNIHYADGHYWIAFSSEPPVVWDLGCRYPFIRKILAIVVKYVGWPPMEENSGVFVVDLEGNPTAHYRDHGLRMITSGIRVGTHLYCGSALHPYILRLDTVEHPALSVT